MQKTTLMIPSTQQAVPQSCSHAPAFFAVIYLTVCLGNGLLLGLDTMADAAPGPYCMHKVLTKRSLSSPIEFT